MKKIALLLALACGIYGFSQSGEKLAMLNGKIASENLIERVKKEKGFTQKASQSEKFHQYSISKASFDAIALSRLNEMNELPKNTPIWIDGVKVEDTQLQIFMDGFAKFEKQNVNGEKVLVFSSKNTEK